MAKPKQKPESQWDPKTRRFFGIVFAFFGLVGVFVLVSRYTTAAATQAVLAVGGTVNSYADLGTELGAVDLHNRPITDADLARLHSYFFWSRGPAVLNLAGTLITDAGLAHLSGLLFLSQLDLSETAINGSGLVHLRKMGFVGRDEGGIAVELNLSKTKIDNTALLQIAQISALNTLILTNCPNIDAAGVDALRKQRPNLSVIH